MIVNADAKSLEWVVGTYLSQDKVAMQEIWENVDAHTSNQIKFKLPGWEDAAAGIKSDKAKFGRGIAKIFVFRLIYGGTSYSYANDPDFASVSTSQKFWDGVIDKFYEKYQGWSGWHTKLMQEATTTGKIVMPTGRVYTYSLTKFGDWPRTTILNYPVQGLGADVMAIVRVAFYKRLKQRGFKSLPIITVHDSIVLDALLEEVEALVKLFHEVFKDTPKLFEQWFGKPFNLPLQCEVSTGHNMADLKEFKLAD